MLEDLEQKSAEQICLLLSFFQSSITLVFSINFSIIYSFYQSPGKIRQSIMERNNDQDNNNCTGERLMCRKK